VGSGVEPRVDRGAERRVVSGHQRVRGGLPVAVEVEPQRRDPDGASAFHIRHQRVADVQRVRGIDASFAQRPSEERRIRLGDAEDARVRDDVEVSAQADVLEELDDLALRVR